MKSKWWIALGASMLALALVPASASATGSSESPSDSGGNCSSSGALIAANCTNISGPQVQAGGGLENEQNQNNNQQNGDNSGTENTNTNGVASTPSDDYEGEESSGSGGNCSQHGALIAANCTNYSGGQYQTGGGLENEQNQNNNQQNGDNSGTSNANTNGVAADNGNGYEGDSESSGSGGNCSQSFAAVAANCTNISKGQHQSGGDIRCELDCASFEVPGGGGSSAGQNQNNNQQNGDNSGTSNANTNGVAGGHGSWSGDEKSGSSTKEHNEQPSGSGGNCSQRFAALAINCTNYSGGQWQSSGGEVVKATFVEPPGGGSQGSPQNQNNNQQNGDNSGTENTNSNSVGGGHGPWNGNSKSGSSTKEHNEQPSGGGRNCTQSFVIFAANCTNISKGQWQSSDGGRIEMLAPAPVPGGSGGPQNQNNNQQNGDNSGTENTNSNSVGGRQGPSNGNGNSGSWSNNDTEHPSGGGRNCTQSFAAFALNCTNYSGGQWQSGGGGGLGIPFVGQPGGSQGSPQNQNNNQQNGDNSGTENYNSNSVGAGHRPSNNNGHRKSEPAKKNAGKDEPRSGGGRNCTQSFAFVAANCTNYIGGQSQSAGGRRASFVEPGSGGQGSPQNQNNNQQNGDNRGTENYNSNQVVEHRSRPRFPV